MHSWLNETMNWWINHSVIQWIQLWIIESMKQGTTESMNQRIDVSVNQWVTELMIRWNTDSMNPCMHDLVSRGISESMNHWFQWTNESTCCYAGTLNSSLHALFSFSDWRSVWAKKAAIWIGLCLSLKLEMNAQVKSCMFHWCTNGKWRNGNLHSSFGETSGPPKFQELSDSSCFSV